MLWGGGRLLVAFSIPFLFSWFIASSVIVPTIIPNTSATESLDKNTSTSTTDKGYSLSISIPKTVTIDLTPTPSSSFSYSELNTQVTTTNPTGYTLSFNTTTIDPTNPGTTTNPNYTNSLIHTNTNLTNLGLNNTNTIPSISSNTTYTNFPTNSWGYSTVDNSTTNVTNATIESLTFKPIPLPSSSTQDKQLKVTNLADNSTTPTANNNTKLILGIKADNNLASGTYAGQLTFSVTANYVPNPTFSGITNMQQMTSAICAAETTPTNTATQTTTEHSDDTNLVPEATLTDTRDGNTYVVRKLADGKCWMTQNLRLGTQALPSAATASSNITLTSADSNVSSNFTIPTSAVQTSGYTDWGGSSSNETVINTTHVYNNGNSWIQPTSEGNKSTVNTTGTPPNQSQYMGNYYNWYTATAGTGTYAMTSGNASSSICPKGWKLPTGGANSDFTGLTGALVNITTNTNNAAASFTMQSAPNYFVLSGDYVSGMLRGQGSGSYWWSRTATGSTYAYNMGLGTADVGPRNYYGYKYGGFSVRCVAQ